MQSWVARFTSASSVPSSVKRQLQRVPASWSFGAPQKEDAAHAMQTDVVSAEGMAGALVLQLNSAFSKMVLDFEGFSPLYACSFMR